MRTILYTQEQARNTPHKEGVYFLCDRCRLIKPVGKNLGTGYGYTEDNSMHCYACCGQTDRLRMIETGKAVLYLTKDPAGQWELSNWPGTLRIKPMNVVKFHHPFSRQAYIAYFRFKGADWSARNIGDSQIARARRLKHAIS